MSEKRSYLFIGIDPGLSGAVTAVDGGGHIISVQDTPVVSIKHGKGKRNVYLETQMFAILDHLAGLGYDTCVALENVHAIPKQGVTSMFSLGVGMGLWRMAVAALRLPLFLIEPAVWKREMHVSGDKGRSIVRALELFPAAAPYLKRKADHGRADALLLGEFQRRRTLAYRDSTQNAVSRALQARGVNAGAKG